MAKNLKFLTFLLVVSGFVYLSLMPGCGTEVVAPPPVDSLDVNIKILNNLLVDETVADSSHSGINFYDLKVELSSSTEKDAKLIDSVGEGMRFIIRSGDLGLLGRRLPGFTTKFYPMYNDMPRKQFDTLSKIFYYSTLDTLDFITGNTYYHQYPLVAKPVYAFYLAERKWRGFNSGVIVYGMFMIDSLYKTSDSVAHARLDIKINKAGKDQFNPYHH